MLEWKPPHARWFIEGRTNLAYNCLDRHLPKLKDKPAILFEGEPGDRRSVTYGELAVAVNRLANGLKSLGVRKGDRVGIYLPMVPEAAVAMLACARIGAVHSVVFGGFSAEALQERMNDAGAKVLLTADGGWRKGAVVPLKKNVDEAVPNMRTVEKVVVLKRAGDAVAAGPQGRVLGGAGPRPERRVRAGVGGERAPAVHPLHLGLDGEAQGRAAHHGRLRGERVADHAVGVRPEGGRRLLVHGGRGLGDGAQLRRLRAADERRHDA